MTKNRYNAMHAWFLGLLLLSALPLFAQQDSSEPDANNISDTTRSVADTIRDTTQPRPVQQPLVVDMKLTTLQGRVGALEQQIDSVKSDHDTVLDNTNWLDTTQRPSSGFLDEKVRDITVLKREINRYRQDLRTQRQSGATSENDSMQDSGALRELQLGIEDSLSYLDRRLDGLLDNVVEIRQHLADPILTDTIAQDSSYSATMEVPTTRRVISSIRKNLDSDKPLYAFFDYAAWSGRILLILLTGAYFYWMFLLGKNEENEQKRWRLFKHVPIWIPLVKSLIFFLILLPLTAYVIPIFVLQMSYLLIFLLLYSLLYTQFSAAQKKAIRVVFGLFLLLIVTNLIISEALWIRLISGVFNAVGLIVTWRIGQSTREGEPANHIRSVAKWAILFGFTVSIVGNAFGYIYLARISSIASSIGLIQALALRAFSEMLLTDLEQHYNKVAKENLIRRFDLTRMLNSLNRLISLVCVIIVGIVLVNNLNITTRTANFVQGVLYKEHSLGSITFNYANLLLAVLVLWGSNWIQKNLKHLLNDPSSDELQMKRMTLFPLFRLVLVVVSFFFAISILGLGLDKLTVIVGALTVGIGFGLQNIINNLVSGVILVFEKPFKIGDYIELADKKGQVLEIGIRSSVLLTDQGAKVIIPNADLFSGRLVNWTFSSTDIRVNMDLSITGSTNIEDVKERLRTRLKNDRFVDKSIPMKVYTKDIQPDTYKISIQVGVKNVRQIERFRSQFLEGMKEELSTIDVGIASI